MFSVSPDDESGSGSALTHMLARPGIKTAWDWPLAAAAFRRNVEAENVGVTEQRGKIRWLEEAFRLGVDGIERFFRQRIAQMAGATRQRAQRRRSKDGDAKIGEPPGAAA